jgi:hypothetical protein
MPPSAPVVMRARELLQGVDADDLRTAGDLRVRVQAGMSAISAELDEVMKRPWGRKLGLCEPASC